MACQYSLRIYFYFLFFILSTTKSLQLTSDGKAGKSCNCYEQCQKNFTANSINYEQSKEACQRGCRFFSLILHSSQGPVGDYGHARHGCMASCSESYINPVEMTACNFGCSSIKATDSCDAMEHQLPQITSVLVIEESDVLIHPGDPEPDDVLIDPGLRKQIEKTLETLLDSKPKLPEIHFRNLPVMNKEMSAEHPRTTFKCPKFYGFDSKLEFRNCKITSSDLPILFSLTVIAIICFVVGRNLEKQRKLWKQLKMNLLHTRPAIMKMKGNLMEDELQQDDYFVRKLERKELVLDDDLIDTSEVSRAGIIECDFFGSSTDEEHDNRGVAQQNRDNLNDFP